MLFPLIFLLNLTYITETNPVTAAIENYKIIESYSVTLKSKEDDSIEILKYYYRKPGFIRIEFIKPNKGAVLVYNPLKKKVKLKPFSFFNSLILTLDPDNILNGILIEEVLMEDLEINVKFKEDFFNL